VSLDAALIYEPARGWYLAPSSHLEAVIRQQQTPPRSFQEDPMTVATDLGTCRWASCREKATGSNKQGWDFCPEHTAADAELQQEDDYVIQRAPSQPLPRATPLTSVPSAPASPLGLLLEQASGHSAPKVRRLAQRIDNHLIALRALLLEHSAQEKARQAADKAQAEVRAEVGRLEEQLRAAKAKLGKPASGGPGKKHVITPEGRARMVANGRATAAAKAAKRAAAGTTA